MKHSLDILNGVACPELQISASILASMRANAAQASASRILDNGEENNPKRAFHSVTLNPGDSKGEKIRMTKFVIACNQINPQMPTSG